MPTILPMDSFDNVIPALRLKTGGAHNLAEATGASARNSAAFHGATRVVSLYATGPVYVAFGDSSVSASSSDHYFPADTYYDFAIGGDRVAQASHVAVLAADSACTVYVSEKE